MEEMLKELTQAINVATNTTNFANEYIKKTHEVNKALSITNRITVISLAVVIICMVGFYFFSDYDYAYQEVTPERTVQRIGGETE